MEGYAEVLEFQKKPTIAGLFNARDQGSFCFRLGALWYSNLLTSEDVKLLMDFAIEQTSWPVSQEMALNATKIKSLL